MVTWQSSSRQSSFQPPSWGLGAAQAQMDAIAAALMPLGVSPSGRVQVPSIEIETTADAVVVTAFLPGVDPRLVNVRATQTSLTFSGQQQSGHRSSLLQSPLLQSFGINYFQQTVPLPERVLDRQVQVANQQGAIIVTLPRDKGWSQRLARGWQRLRYALGQSLKALGQRLLEDR